MISAEWQSLNHHRTAQGMCPIHKAKVFSIRDAQRNGYQAVVLFDGAFVSVFSFASLRRKVANSSLSEMPTVLKVGRDEVRPTPPSQRIWVAPEWRKYTPTPPIRQCPIEGRSREVRHNAV